MPSSSSPEIQLTVTIEDAPDPVLLGEQMRWSIQVKNEDPAGLHALSVDAHDVLPQGVTFLSAAPSQGECALQGVALTCALGDIAFGATASLELLAVIQSDAPEGLLTNAVAVTSFAPGASQASAVVVSAHTTVLAQYPVEKQTIAISPACVEPGGSLTIAGEGFDQLGLEAGDIHIGDMDARILASSPTGLVVEMPPLPDGFATVFVTGAANAPQVEVKNSCHSTAFTAQDVQEGFIAGDVLIYFKEEMSPQALEAFRVEYGFKTLIQHPLLGYYFAQLGPEADPDVQEQASAPVSCLVNKRSSAPPLDLLLLVDRSGSMDLAFLRPLLKELANQMYCLVNRTSRIALMSYASQARLELEPAPWLEQRQALLNWLEQPLETKGRSDLAQGLNQALGYLKERKQPGIPQQIMILTRGPSSPRLQDLQPQVQQAQDQGVVIHGVALTNFIFRAEAYGALQALAQATQRDLQLLDERDMAQAAGMVACSIVYGLYGEECSQSPVYATPLSDAVTCAIVSGIYGVGVCGREGLEQIPSIRVDRTGEVIEQLNRDPRVDEAFFNDLLDKFQEDPDLLKQDWFLELGLPQGWGAFFPKQGEGATVAIIDTGVDLNVAGGGEPEVTLDAIAPDGLNLAPESPDDKDTTGNDELGHGTAVSSIAASVIGNGVNGAGVAPKATVIALKVFSIVEGHARTSNDSVARALMNAFVLGVDVVNMSLGCGGCDAEQEERMRSFYDRVINSLIQGRQAIHGKIPILVAAAGNDGKRFIDAPAFHPQVIAVGSVRPHTYQRSSFSNYGPELDFVVVAEDTKTTIAGGTFGNAGSGTSFASPQVAGFVALILAQEPGLQLEAVVDKIKRCFVADVGSPGFDEQTGWGRIKIPPPEQADPACLPAQ